jgi:L-ascorbate metabolism protein UlaG (beta-lactamase superfamily)
MTAIPWTVVLLALALSCSGADLGAAEARSEEKASQEGLSRELQDGQAVIWYLYHSGWAVKTRNHLLIFDYTETPSRTSEHSLDSGSVDPSEIADQNVTVFISHRHFDHHDPLILGWRSVVKKIRYVWGWEEGGSPEDVRFGRERRTFAADGLEILNVHHEFDGLPESAFLVKADGLTILHAGDHSHSLGMENAAFKENILYLAEQAPRLDIFFVPTFGNEMEALRTLEPRAVFPMHSGGRERQYIEYAGKMKALQLQSEVGTARKMGDAFLYSGGKVTPLRP